MKYFAVAMSAEIQHLNFVQGTIGTREVNNSEHDTINSGACWIDG